MKNAIEMVKEEKQQEIWRDIVGYEGAYQASNLGNIKSLNFCNKGKERLLKPSFDGKSYMAVKLYKNSVSRTIKVHQLIAIAFLDHIPDGHKLVVNHKNFISTDNRLENLEIITSRENGNRKHIPSSSKFIGVYWNSQCKKWQSYIHIKGKPKYLGVFDSEIEAGECYQAALKAHNSGERIIPIKKQFKGYYFNKIRNKWHSRIVVNRKPIHIGYFDSEPEASRAYQDKLKSVMP